MPARGDRNAPQFDSSKPRELPRYFSDLEFHFNRVGITDATEKKGHSTRFLSVEEQDIWESLDEFKPTSTYEQFKAAVLKLYPGTDANRKYTLADLDALVGEYARLGIFSRGDYSEFYRQFLVITQFLISRQRLSIAEQSRSFRRAIAPAHLWARVHQRLQIKKPDVHPDDPYELTDLHEAVQFVLSDTSSGHVATNPSNSPPASSSAPEIKQEPGISALLESMNGLIKVLTAQQQQQLQRAPQSQPLSPRTDLNCSYCSEPGHFIIKCPHVDEDIQAGKCKRDTEGRVTLPSGRNLRARIEEWHRQNPGQIAAAQLMLEVATKHLSTSTFTLSEEERIKSLEREIFALRTRSQARKAAAAGEPVERPEQPIRITAPAPPALVRDTTAAPSAPPGILKSPANAPVTPPASETPEHPFANARDAAYAPPHDRNVGVRFANPAPQKKPEPAYRTTAPIYDEKIANTVFGRSMDAPITLTQRELLSLSPEVRAQVRDATTSRPFAHSSQNDLPPNSIVVHDIYESFYNSGDIPDDLIVSMDSSAIRSILPIVDNKQQVESIVDGGSQIIGMSEAICHELGISYDPRIVLKMQSANGSISPSLGLARNVPFRIGDITLYLQVHVVRNPAYDILLGRPFDILTESIVRNFADENQTITIRDPNTGKVSTVPTIPRGSPRSRAQGFQHSRN
ncbi:hypothetical protein C8J57DRAFT_1439505 [Mycena rebaudengoi]|nr:hypothetical protein C8J57DRAFT_1439505 [Mycena rebaudengoi]